jgi:serine/threonine protein kinase
MRRCADQVDCGYENRDSELFCRACALPLLNTSLMGRYVVEALISKGGYAAVFRGVDQNLSRNIAIKVLLPSKTTHGEREHFLREARIAGTLDHPNIAPIMDYGQDGPSVFLVMPLYTAGSLRTRLAQVDGPLPTQEVIHNFHQLASALQYAHTRPRPIIHRDIKPENILIHQEDYRLVITDFGIARSLEPGALFGKTVTVRGTVGYMAPEQSSGVVDPRSDQYGCAVVLYEMLTGYHPLDPFGNAPPPVTQLNPELPNALDGVMYKALAAHVEDRYSNMQEFNQAFDQAWRPVGKVRQAHATNQGNYSRTGARVREITNASAQQLNMHTGRGSAASVQAAPKKVNTGSIQEKCREGEQYLRQQQFSLALQAFEEALNMDPRNLYAWNGKGTAHYNQGNYRRAFEAYQHAIDIAPEEVIVWVSAGVALNCLKRYQQAVVHFERALSLDPNYVAAWNGKADAQLGLNKPEEAFESYRQALTNDPKSFSAWNGLGNAYSHLRDFTGAVEAYTQALMLNSRSAIAWCNKAEALLQLGHNRAALDALNEATEQDKTYGPAWNLKAEVYELLGNPQEAQKARKRARPWGPKN